MTVKWVAYTITEINNEINIENSEHQSIVSSNPQELLNFLYTPFRDTKNRELKFFWDLDSSMALIFRLMKIEELKWMLDVNKIGKEYHLYNYDVSYSRDRNFIIKGDKQIENRQYWCCLYGLKQFLNGYDEPKNTNELFSLSQKLKQSLENIGITTPMSLNSPISIYESSMRGIELTPSIKYIPEDKIDVINYAEKCAQRQGFISAYQVGHFDAENIFDYDVSGSYAHWLSLVRDYKEIEITPYSPNYPYKKEIVAGDVTGFFKVELTIFDDIIVHPFAYIDETGNILYPTGKFETYLTLEEMMSIIRYKVGIIKVIDGYYVRFLNHGLPMFHVVNRLFQKRSLGSIENDFCKGVLVQYVGKANMVSKKTEDPSKTYNPLLTGQLYAKARLQVFDFIMQNDLVTSLVAVSTDGILTTKKATHTKIETQRKLGTWRCKEQLPAIVLSPGWILYNDRHQKGIFYKDLLEAIEHDPNNNRYKFITKQRTTLYRAVEELKDISKVGQISDHSNTIDLIEIQASQDRIFKKFPSNGKQLLSKIYNSSPIQV